MSTNRDTRHRSRNLSKLKSTMSEQTIKEMAALSAVADTLNEQANPEPEISSNEENSSSDDSSEEEEEKKPRSDKGGKAPKKRKSCEEDEEDIPIIKLKKMHNLKILSFYGPNLLTEQAKFRGRIYYIRMETGVNEWHKSHSFEKEKSLCVDEFWSQEFVLHWVRGTGSKIGTMSLHKFNTQTHKDGPMIERKPNPHYTKKSAPKDLSSVIQILKAPVLQAVQVNDSVVNGSHANRVLEHELQDVSNFRQTFQDAMIHIQTSLGEKLSSMLQPVYVKLDSQTELVSQINSKISSLTDSQLQTQKQFEQFQASSNLFFTNMQGYFSQSHEYSKSVQQFMAETDKRTNNSFEKSNVLMQSLTSNVESLVKDFKDSGKWLSL